MTIIVVNKNEMIVDRLIWSNDHGYRDMYGDTIKNTGQSPRVATVPKMRKVKGNAKIAVVTFCGANTPLITSIMDQLDNSNLTLNDIFITMSKYNMKYLPDTAARLITLSTSGKIDSLNISEGSLKYVNYTEGDHSHVFGSGLDWLYPFEGGVSTMKDHLSPEELIIMAQCFSFNFGTNYDRYCLETDTIELVEPTMTHRKKVHKAAMRKITSMSPLHPSLS